MNFFKKLFNRIEPVKFKTVPEHEIEFVFMSGVEAFYKFVNPQKGPYLRMVKALDIYTELHLRISDDYMKSFLDALSAAAKKGDLEQVFILTHYAKQRRENISDTMQMYKLASVMYFTADENCYDYDYEYNEKKINKWIKNGDVEGFFLKEPMENLAPYFNGSNQTFQQYLKVEANQLLIHLKYHLSILSKDNKDNATIVTLNSQVRTLENYLASKEEQL